MILEVTRKMTTKEQLAYDLGYANGKAERSPVPDPETGLVPCGCGGKTVVDKYEGLFSISCQKCGFTSKDYISECYAKRHWNTAHGYNA